MTITPKNLMLALCYEFNGVVSFAIGLFLSAAGTAFLIYSIWGF